MRFRDSAVGKATREDVAVYSQPCTVRELWERAVRDCSPCRDLKSFVRPSPRPVGAVYIDGGSLSPPRSG